MPSLQQLLGRWAERQLKITPGVPAIREQGELWMHRETLRGEDLKEPAFRLLVIGLDKANALI
jgi:hypothetical protein